MGYVPPMNDTGVSTTMNGFVRYVTDPQTGTLPNIVCSGVSPTMKYIPPTSIPVDDIIGAHDFLNPLLIGEDIEMRSHYNVNWRSVPDIAANLHLFPSHLHQLIRNILAVKEQRAPHANNILNGLLMTCSEGYRYDSINQCLSFTKHRYGACTTWRLCPQCAHYESKKFVHRYSPLWDKRPDRCNVSFVTISSPGFDMVLNQEGMIAFWDDVAHRMQNLCRYKKLHGVIYSEETAIMSLDPLTVNGHVHMIVFGDFPEDKFADLDVDVQPITDKANYENLLAYLVKAINLWSVYDNEWTREKSELINRQLAEFTRGFGVLVWRRKQMRYFGFVNKLTPKKKAQRKAKPSSRSSSKQTISSRKKEDCQSNSSSQDAHRNMALKADFLSTHDEADIEVTSVSANQDSKHSQYEQCGGHNSISTDKPQCSPNHNGSEDNHSVISPMHLLIKSLSPQVAEDIDKQEHQPAAD